jgi:hypothetical protein
MDEFNVTVDVPENRQVVLTLPPDVPTGPRTLRVRVTSPIEEPPIEVKLDPRPPSPRSPATESPLRGEIEAFDRLLPELLKTHAGQYVAVYQGRVIAAGPDQLEVVKRSHAKFGRVPILVRLVTDQPPPLIRVPSFREVSGSRE